MCVYISTYIYEHNVYIYISIYTHTHTYICNTHTHIYICIYIYKVQTCQATPSVANSSGSCKAEVSHLKGEGVRQHGFY